MNQLDTIIYLAGNLNEFVSHNTLSIRDFKLSLGIYRDAYDDGHGPKLGHIADDRLALKLDHFKIYPFELLDAIARLSFENYSRLIRAVLETIPETMRQAGATAVLEWPTFHNAVSLSLAARPVSEFSRIFDELLLPIDLARCFTDKIFWRFFILRNGTEQLTSLYTTYLQYRDRCKKDDADFLTRIVPLYAPHIISERIFAADYDKNNNPQPLPDVDALLCQMLPDERENLPNSMHSSICNMMLQASKFLFERTTEKLFNLIDIEKCTATELSTLMSQIASFQNTEFIIKVCETFVENFHHNCSDKHFMTISGALFKMLSSRRSRRDLRNYVEKTIVTLFDNDGKERPFEDWANINGKPTRCFIGLMKNSIHFKMPNLFVVVFDFVHKKDQSPVSTPYPWLTFAQHNKDLIVALMSCRCFERLWPHILQKDSKSIITRLLSTELTPVQYNLIAQNNPVYANTLCQIIFGPNVGKSVIIGADKLKLKENRLHKEQHVIFSLTSLKTIKNVYNDQNLNTALIKDSLLTQARDYHLSLSLPDRNNPIQPYDVEAFSMNLTLVADYVFSSEDRRLILTTPSPDDEGIQIFRSFYKQGLLLWAKNHLIQRSCAAIQHVQSHIEHHCLEEHPYHGIWTVRKYPGFDKIHHKYEELASQLEAKQQKRRLIALKK